MAPARVTMTAATETSLLRGHRMNINRSPNLKAFILAVCVSPWIVGCGPHLAPHARVPSHYQHQPPELVPGPIGQPERIRYRVSYDAFWWNCAIVRSRDLDARCPFMCSGTNAAAAGCRQDSADADDGISALVKRYGRSRTRDYLNSLVLKSNGFEKIKSYFTNGPRVEDVPKYP